MKEASGRIPGLLRDKYPWGKVLGLLARHYEVGDWRVPYLNASSTDPFRVLVSTILSQRTRDEVTHGVAESLFERYPTAAALAGAREADIARRIRRIGFSRAKAKAIRAACREIVDRYGGKVPTDVDQLLELPMVGRKTANCVLVYAYDTPAIPVDTHVHRISHLLGVTETRTPEETEEVLRHSVPRSLWKAVNPLLVQHGQNICRPTGPRCDECPVRRYCATGTRGRPAKRVAP